MEESYVKTGHELIEYGGLMEESYVKTGHELIEYWTRILSVAIKRQATSTNILWNLWSSEKRRIWYQMNLISTNASDTQFMLTANIIP